MSHVAEEGNCQRNGYADAQRQRFKEARNNNQDYGRQNFSCLQLPLANNRQHIQ